MIFSDVETSARERIDLLKMGHVKYWRDPETRIITWGVAFDDHPSWTLKKAYLDVPAAELGGSMGLLRDRIEDGEDIGVFNAEFEYLAYNWLVKNRGWPRIDYTQFVDVALMMRQMNLPHRLEDAARCVSINLGLPVWKKHFRGYQLMKKFCKLEYWDAYKRGEIDPLTHKDEYYELCKYCEQDVELTRFLYKLVPAQIREQPNDTKIFQLINERGVGVDGFAASRLVTLEEDEKEEAAARMREISDGAVGGPTKLKDLKEWLHSKTGVLHASLSADIIADLLDNKELDPDVEEMLVLRRDGGMSSTAKLQRMIDASIKVDGVNRLCGMYMPHGAGTGRKSSKLVQIHNLPRDRLKYEAQHIHNLHNSGTDTLRSGLLMLEGTVLRSLSRLIRPLFIPGEGKKFIGADFKQIEARMLAFVTGELDVIDLYKRGEDPYRHIASRIYGVPVDSIGDESVERQVGKTADLACGYGGSERAFEGMARKFGLHLTEDTISQAVSGWRETHANTVRYWHKLSLCVYQVMSADPGEFIGSVGRPGCPIEFKYFRDSYHLYCKLPSGRYIVYPFAKIEETDGPYGLEDLITYTAGRFSARKDATDWPRKRLWHGILIENNIQAVCADILDWAIEVLEGKGYPVVLNTHDEFTCEVDSSENMNDLAYLFTDLNNRPYWMEGFPFDLSWWEGDRYAK